jgi:hypothetical protein
MSLDVDAYIQRHLTEYQAELRAKTMFGPAGKQVIRHQGERVVLAPNGAKIRVIQLPAGAGIGHTQVEHGDHLHANVRPDPLNLKVTQ